MIGGDLDSLSDVISFGVAPAVLGFTLGLRGGWDMLCLTYFVVCGVSRLARFNVTAAGLADAATGKVKYFEGTPIPIEHPHRRAARRRVQARIGSTTGCWFGACQLGPALLHPLSLHLCAERQRHDQRHAPRSQTLTRTAQRPGSVNATYSPE